METLRDAGLPEGVAVANNTRFGLSSAIYTSDVQTSHRAVRDLEAGITYVNGPTVGAEAHMPFGGRQGHRQRLPRRVGRLRGLYAGQDGPRDYSGRLQKAQMDSVED